MKNPQSSRKQPANGRKAGGPPPAGRPSPVSAKGGAPAAKPAAGINPRTIAMVLAVVLIVAVVGGTALAFIGKSAPRPGATTAAGNAAATGQTGAPAAGKTAAGLNAAGDLVIPVSGVSSKATFYPATVDGVKLEVLAVKAPDNSIRTAFNTCQVCYDSGRGYYKQEGDVLVCQNCGNRFKISQVEVSKGGCNPVPIFDKEIKMDSTNITIPAAYLKEATEIFENWKVAA